MKYFIRKSRGQNASKWNDPFETFAHSAHSADSAQKSIFGHTSSVSSHHTRFQNQNVNTAFVNVCKCSSFIPKCQKPGFRHVKSTNCQENHTFFRIVKPQPTANSYFVGCLQHHPSDLTTCSNIHIKCLHFAVHQSGRSRTHQCQTFASLYDNPIYKPRSF